ncbi:hypothetical protein [Dyadobacter frigoris]|uniref:Lipoprotein n=1 Tax=Dyadobacter frigoris TaxID=2576211 RepID=A0A4U6CQJ0_9BACT|nr:hypothetical protein [Dyadobacter frigoris]TKT85711.1 hypothetical protein FDK13_33290 [Dyadobacter frigoris]
MKNLNLLFLIFFTLASCRKKPEPDLAEKFVGDYYGSKTDGTVITTENWKITKQDLNHVNVIFYFTNTYPNGNVTRSKYDIYIPDVTVSENNVLDFNNHFVFDQLENIVIGKANRTNDIIDYDIVITDEYSTRKLSNKIYRQ